MPWPGCGGQETCRQGQDATRWHSSAVGCFPHSIGYMKPHAPSQVLQRRGWRTQGSASSTRLCLGGSSRRWCSSARPLPFRGDRRWNPEMGEPPSPPLQLEGRCCWHCSMRVRMAASLGAAVLMGGDGGGLPGCRPHRLLGCSAATACCIGLAAACACWCCGWPATAGGAHGSKLQRAGGAICAAGCHGIAIPAGGMSCQ